MAYTNIDDPSAHFQAKAYTGNGDSSDDTNALTNDGNSDLKPDLTWFKRRDYDNQHLLFDSTRGVTKYLTSDRNDAEGTIADRLVSFNTDGFTVKSSSGAVNQHDEPFICWQWKANGGTTSTNNDGNHSSVVQANQDAGFSIITYTGTGNTSTTIGHGLGVTPDLIIFKRRDAGTNNWDVQIKGEARTTLNTDGTEATNVLCTFTSTTTTLGSSVSGEKNTNTATYVAYAFASKQGYSKIGRYVGTSNADGPFVYTGFKPAFILIKGNSNYKYWYIFDNKLDPINQVDTGISPSNVFAENTNTNIGIDFLSNGFKLRNSATTTNESGTNTLYMAFAENPFTTSTGIPTTAR
jgi:hypothetical protein